MAQRSEVYVCEKCGHVIEVLGKGGGKLVCCGQAMTLQNANVVDASKEKHVPVVTIRENQVSVQVGSTLHPSEAEHYIVWIEVTEGDMLKRKYLKAGDEPRATFCTEGGAVSVRAYCNLHGLWKAE